MDYEVINAAINDIICIVNNYNNDRNYSNDLCERLVIALLGYYLVFGPSIFEKINIVLEVLEIYECGTLDECRELKMSMINDYSATPNPATNWDYKYDEKRKFIGAVPRIIYANDDIIRNSLSLAHELSHVLEGTCGKVISEDDKSLVIEQSLCKMKIDKSSNKFIADNMGIVELVTIIIENRIFKEFLKLDFEKIDNLFVRKFVQHLSCYKKGNFLINSYEIMASMFSDLINNDYFFELIRKYYYTGDSELFTLEYNSLGEGLNFDILKNIAEHVKDGELYDVMYYSSILRKQVDLFNQYTGVETDKRILIFV